jgi:hypothetical protein
MTPLDYEMRARLAGLANVIKHGGKAAVAPAMQGLAAKHRAIAIANGAVDEDDIQRRCAALRKQQAVKAVLARHAKKKVAEQEGCARRA